VDGTVTLHGVALVIRYQISGVLNASTQNDFPVIGCIFSSLKDFAIHPSGYDNFIGAGMISCETT